MFRPFSFSSLLIFYTFLFFDIFFVPFPRLFTSGTVFLAFKIGITLCCKINYSSVQSFFYLNCHLIDNKHSIRPISKLYFYIILCLFLSQFTYFRQLGTNNFETYKNKPNSWMFFFPLSIFRCSETRIINI